MIKLVVFDLGNVILPFDHLPIARRLHATARDRGASTPDGVHHHIFDWDDESYIRYEEGAIDTARFFDEIRARFDLDLNLDGFKAIWNDIFSLDRDVAAIIEALKARGVRLFILSNTNEMHWTHCRATYPVMGLFDTLIASHEVRLRKPFLPIFEELLRRAPGVAPGEVIFVDDWEKNIAGAAAAGIATHHFTGAAGLRARLVSEGLLPRS